MVPRPTIGDGTQGRGEVEVRDKAEVHAQDVGHHQNGNFRIDPDGLPLTLASRKEAAPDADSA